MRLEQLFYFKTLVQENSFNKAASKLHISQPSLTASMKSLENELNTTLLIRNARGFSLTEDGKKVLTFSQNVASLYQALQNDLTQNSQTPTGKFAIVTAKFFAEIIMEQFLLQFQTKFPQIEISLIENEFHASPDKLASTSCRFAVTHRISALQEEGCVPGLLLSDEDFFAENWSYLPLFSDVFGFCCPKNSLLASQSPIYPTTLVQNNFPATCFPFQDCAISERLLLSSSNVKLLGDTMLRADAYCNIPYFVYKNFFAQEEGLTFRSYSNHISITYYLIYPTDHVLTAAEQLFIEELQGYLSQMEFR